MSPVVDNQIRFRADEELLQEIQARSFGQSLSGVAYRDLNRYYQLLAAHTPKFTEPEASLLLEALRHRRSDAPVADLIWAAIDDAIQHDRLDEKYGIDRAQFIARLRHKLSPFEQFAIVDAVERVGRIQPRPKTRKEKDFALQQVGLVERGRTRVERSWDKLYEIASEAIIDAGSEVYGDHPAVGRYVKTGTPKLDEAIPLMVKKGQIDRHTGEQFRQLQEWHQDILLRKREVPSDEATDFVGLAGHLEKEFRRLVPSRVGQ